MTKTFDIPEETDLRQEIQSSFYERTRLVIVGAGIAGLAAAKTLDDYNFQDYLILEGRTI